MIILTNDPSMTAWGWAVIELSKDSEEILEYGCIKTEPTPKKKRIRKSDDRIRRLNEITKELIRIHKKYDIDWILSEAPHGSQSAVAAIMIGATTGLLCSFALSWEIPIEWYSEGDSKKFLTGKRSVSKSDMIDIIKGHYGSGWIEKVKYKDEAVADALAVFHIGRSESPALTYAMNQDQKNIRRTK